MNALFREHKDNTQFYFSKPFGIYFLLQCNSCKHFTKEKFYCTLKTAGFSGMGIFFGLRLMLLLPNFFTTKARRAQRIFFCEKIKKGSFLSAPGRLGGEIFSISELNYLQFLYLTVKLVSALTARF